MILFSFCRHAGMPGAMARRMVNTACAVWLVAGAMCIAATPAVAQVGANRTEVASASFDVPAGALNVAIVRFGRQSGLQFSVDSKLTNGKRTAGLKGHYSAEDALRALLAGSGLTFRYTGPRTVVIEKLPETGDVRVLGPLRVEGSAGTGLAASGTNGVNGSTDITATEGTGSYTSGAMTVGTKAAASLKDTAQSVSVVTRKQIEDQNLADVYEVMEQMPGLSMVTGANSSDINFYSRGFAVQKFQIDGGAPIRMKGDSSSRVLQPVLDTAMYDHVEVLRGADGLFNGYGEPGGTVNLIRKRPLDHRQLIVEGQYGSWNNRRMMLDAGAPLGFGGKLRGRAVAAQQDRGFFYKLADSDRTTLYSVLEADLRPGTVVSLGASHSKLREGSRWGGLPRYEDGRDLGLPRDTCLCLPWSVAKTSTTEMFARLDQALGENWSLKANLSKMEQKSWWKRGGVGGGAVNPLTLAGPEVFFGGEDSNNNHQLLADLTLAGVTHWFGQKQEFVFGANSANSSGGMSTSYYPYSPSPAVDVFNFDPYDPRYAERTNRTQGTVRGGGYYAIQRGAYASMRLTFFERLHFSTGVRYSEFRSNEGARTDYGNPKPRNKKDNKTYNRSWPPASYNLSYDFSDAVTAYVGYADIYSPNTSSVDESLNLIPPTTGSNVEAGVKSSLRDGRLNASLSAYRLVRKNFPLRVGYGKYAATYGDIGDGMHFCCYINNPSREHFSQGLDLELSGELLPRLQISTSYTWNENKYRGGFTASQEGKPLVTAAPRHLFKLWADYSFNQAGWLGRLSLGAGVYTRTSAYYAGTACMEYLTDSDGKPTSVCRPGRKLPYEFTQGYNAVFAARAGYRFNDVWQAALNIDNLTDRRYYQTPGSSTGGNWYAEPRNFMLTLRGTF